MARFIGWGIFDSVTGTLVKGFGTFNRNHDPKSKALAEAEEMNKKYGKNPRYVVEMFPYAI